MSKSGPTRRITPLRAPGTRSARPVTKTVCRAVAGITAGVAALALTGCTSDPVPKRPPVPVAKSIGKGEGALNLVAWSGYTENGTSDPRVDWVQPFERRTGCKVAVKYASSTREMVDLLASPEKRYDGVSAPPEVAWQLMSGGHAAPVNPDLVEGFSDIDSRIREPLKLGKQYFGVPFTWGANMLMYDPKAVNPGPTSWAPLFDAAQAEKHSGRIVLRDSPLTIADAALYLRDQDRDLRIKDPFELNQRQLRAASALLAKAQAHVGTYWNHPSEAIEAFVGEGATVGHVWPYHVDVLTRAGRSVAGAVPEGGVTGWVDAWMIGARAENPNCMYQWLNWTLTPDVQQAVAEWAGAAPANPKACTDGRLRQEFCAAYHVGDRAFMEKVEFAHMPPKNCRTGTCTRFIDWAKAWENARK